MMMSKHFTYLKYVIRHKAYVACCGVKTGASLWRLLIHDWSKLSLAEWEPYVTFFYGPSERSQRTKDRFSRAFHHHIHRNPHHWEYWLRYKTSDKSITPLEMPNKYVREMVADWAGAGRTITGEWDIASWYEENRKRIKLHPETRRAVEALVQRMQDSLQG